MLASIVMLTRFASLFAAPLAILATLAAFTATGCAPPQKTDPPAVTARAQAPAGSSVFRESKLAEIDSAILAGISNRALPGAVLWLESRDSNHHRAYGRRAVLPAEEPMSEDTIFDAASLTKVIATAPAILLLVERGKIRIDAPVRDYLPRFTGEGRDAITVRHLLTHTSGLRPGIGLRPEWSGYEAGIERALGEKPTDPPERRFRYSDINFILLGEIVRQVSGVPLNEFCATEIFQPLGMSNTGFLPDPALQPRIAPTTLDRGTYLRGVVHDPTSRRMGGVAGHAGLFTTASDLARFARLFLGEGELDGVRVFRPETVRRMTSVQSPAALTQARRGLGWDIDSPYAGPRGDHFPVGSYGHTGWTGTSIWIDPFSRSFVILLSNRNHPTEDGNVLALRRRVGTLAAEAIDGFNFEGVPGALPRQGSEPTGTRPAPTGGAAATEVRNGIDVLASQAFAPLRKKRIALITNHTGVDRDRNPTIDLLKAAADVDLRALFSPEHGIRGQFDEKVPDGVDAKTGLPIHSLYGETRQPKPEQLKDLDALVFDIQDIGCRFYTYIATMGLCLEAAARANLEFVVLDRVNPINGTQVEGPVYLGTTNHFVAFHAIPLRHGMTVGELARMFNAEKDWKARLSVIPVEGWKRSQWFDETSLPWINTSPNMRTLKEAILYPGVGIVEFAVSVGRGTDTPFEVVGAPYIDDRRFAEALNRAGLPGISFVPIRFTPSASHFKGQECGGVYLMLNDREACRVVDVGILLALTLHRLHPKEFPLDKIPPLLQHPATENAIREGKSLAEIKALWSTDLAEFQARRGPFLLY
ncbi:MAG: exo-beta-N-acetylmuramidase NamZ domain-containing protein [Limisphaerales bacterium]